MVNRNRDDKELDRLIQAAVEPRLDLALADRIAETAFSSARPPFLTALLGVGPRLSLAGAVLAVTLLGLGFLGNGPDMIELITDSSQGLPIFPL